MSSVFGRNSPAIGKTIFFGRNGNLQRANTLVGQQRRVASSSISCLSLLHVSDRPMMRARNLSLQPGFAEQRR